MAKKRFTRIKSINPDDFALIGSVGTEAMQGPLDEGWQMKRELGLAFTETAVQLLARALESLYVRDGVSWMTITCRDIAATKARDEDTEDFIEHARSLKGIQIAVFMRETTKGEVRASFRSKSGLPVNKVAEKFGGGGHAYAAGATLSGISIEEARHLIAAAIRAQVRDKGQRS